MRLRSSASTGRSSLREGLAYLLLIAGVIGDQISTRIVLTRPWIYESNPTTVELMRLGLWLPFDLFLLVATIATSSLFIRRSKFEGRWAVLTFSAVIGIVRFIAAVWNLSLLMGP